MIGLLLWSGLGGGGGAPAPTPEFRAADVFSYYYSPPEVPEPAETIFVSPPENSVFGGGDE